MILFIENKISKAEHYYLKSLKLQKESGAWMTVRIWNAMGLGLVYETEGDTRKAQYFYEKSNKEAEYFGLTKNIGIKTNVFFAMMKPYLNKSKLYKSFH